MFSGTLNDVAEVRVTPDSVLNLVYSELKSEAPVPRNLQLLSRFILGT